MKLNHLRVSLAPLKAPFWICPLARPLSTSSSDCVLDHASFVFSSGPVTHEDTKQVADVQKLIKDIILDGVSANAHEMNNRKPP